MYKFGLDIYTTHIDWYICVFDIITALIDASKRGDIQKVSDLEIFHKSFVNYIILPELI